MPVRETREYYCKFCNYIKTLKKDELPPRRCPGCSHNAIYVGRKNKTLEFKKLSSKERWNEANVISKTIKNIEWSCEECGEGVDGGKLPKPIFIGERLCGNCDALLTRRTGGGMNDPFNYIPKVKKMTKRVSLTLNDKALKQLIELQEAHAFTCLADVIRESISMFKFISEEKRKGHKVIIERKRTNNVEILMPERVMK